MLNTNLLIVILFLFLQPARQYEFKTVDCTNEECVKLLMRHLQRQHKQVEIDRDNAIETELRAVIIATIHIPVTIQRSLVISCLDGNDPTCHEHQDIISRDQNALEPYFAYIVYPKTYQRNAYKNSKTIRKKYKSKTVDDMSSKKFLKGKEKKLWAYFAIPLIVGGSQIISAVIEKFGHLIME